MKNTSFIKPAFLLYLLFMYSYFLSAQVLTGVWHGKINKQNAEVKIIKTGDSITGTSYYYSSPKNYRRYSIKGYFDDATNQVVWWDDQLMEEKTGGLFTIRGTVPMASRADFNCPDNGAMKLDGSSTEKDKEDGDGTVHLQKTNSPTFTDEWDYILDNYTTGTNDPYLIDSIAHLQSTISEVAIRIPNAKPRPDKSNLPQPEKDEQVLPQPESTAIVTKTTEQKFTSRTKKIFTTIPVEGDSISLSFYDNAIVDGDSISLFLDGKMIFSNLRLSEKPLVIKLSVNDLKEVSELTMVAENLGTIPPNTSYLVAMVGDKRYTANLASTEESSAVIRLKKQ